MRTLYSLDEIVLIPAPTSSVRSRSECSVRNADGSLPLFIAPMSCLTDASNCKKFGSLGFNVIVPRSEPWKVRKDLIFQGQWVAIGLDEGELLCKHGRVNFTKIRICLDIANGHQERSLSVCSSLKTVFPNSEIMAGNIANPETYSLYAKVGVDYVRVGIGSGHVCTTSVQTGIHYPMASLIRDCFLERYTAPNREEWKTVPKIVADGGFGYIDQIVKAIALGADYVMLGKIAASFPEACGETREGVGTEYGLFREYYGMSTEKAQKLMHPEPDYVTKHTEGTVRWIPVRENTQEWIDDFTHALKSSMSYCNATSLDSYRGRVQFGLQNPTTFNAYIKS